MLPTCDSPPELLRFRILCVLASVVALCGCHPRRRFESHRSIEGFRFGAYAVVVGPRADTLRVSGTAENVSNHALEDMFGSCYWLNRLSVRAQSHSQSWDSRKWEIAKLPVYRDASGRVIEPACAPVAFVTLLSPGGLVRYELRAPVREILGDSLRAGDYRITARIVINGQETGDIFAGHVRLVPPTS